METFRQRINATKLSLSFGLVLALVCFFCAEATHRAQQQPPSVASQLWYSVAANHSLYDKRVQDQRALSTDLDNDYPSELLPVGSLLPRLQRVQAHSLPTLTPALARFNYLHPPLRAPPVV